VVFFIDKKAIVYKKDLKKDIYNKKKLYMSYFNTASLNERIELKKLTDGKNWLVFPTSSKSQAHFDAVIQTTNTLWIVEMKTRTKVEPTCLIEKYKYDNLVHIRKSVNFDTKIMFITVDASGQYIFDLTNIDVTPYFMSEMGWLTNNDRLNNKPQVMLTRYRIPKQLAKHIIPSNIKIDENILIEEEDRNEYIRYKNEFGLNTNPFLTKVNVLLNIKCKKR